MITVQLTGRKTWRVAATNSRLPRSKAGRPTTRYRQPCGSTAVAGRRVSRRGRCAAVGATGPGGTRR
ncbi:hypothetical protein ACFYO1_24730 [Nocardia sp. NPDC006044]|uniref:hypothetical protein n=1 Tax=Nocardia sp. NPDC006044 TaxID=3364306 RepID=UPI00369F9630